MSAFAPLSGAKAGMSPQRRRHIARLHSITSSASESSTGATVRHVEAGGLISYGIDLRASCRQAAFYVDKILKGTAAGELPIEFPSKLETVIKLRAAKALGIEIASTLLVRADE
jgi:ABC-type uncharacterized transport system substrate-binding protein